MPEFIAGMASLQSKLKTLEFTLQRKALIEAARAGAEIVRDDAERRAPRDTERLAQKMTMRVSGRESDIHEGSVDVGPDKQTFYGLFQELGTAHHAPQPFLVPALEHNKEQISTVMKGTLLTFVKKVAR